jgi:hypothetical protein
MIDKQMPNAEIASELLRMADILDSVPAVGAEGDPDAELLRLAARRLGRRINIPLRDEWGPDPTDAEFHAKFPEAYAPDDPEGPDAAA